MDKLTDDERKFLEEQTFTNMCEFYRKELLMIHRTGHVPRVNTTQKNFLTSRLTRYGVIERSTRRPHQSIFYLLTERTMKYLGLEARK